MYLNLNIYIYIFYGCKSREIRIDDSSINEIKRFCHLDFMDQKSNQNLRILCSLLISHSAVMLGLNEESYLSSHKCSLRIDELDN